MNGYIKHEDENEPPSIPTPENNPLEENSPPEDNPPLGEAPPLALTPEETPSINGGSNDDGTKSEETGDLGVVLESPLLETGEHQGERLEFVVLLFVCLLDCLLVFFFASCSVHQMQLVFCPKC